MGNFRTLDFEFGVVYIKCEFGFGDDIFGTRHNAHSMSLHYDSSMQLRDNIQKNLFFFNGHCPLSSDPPLA